MKKFLNFLGELVYLNFLFIFFSLPIITAGTGIAAAYQVLRMMDRDIEINMMSFYFENFKKLFKKTMVVNLIMVFLAGLFILISSFLWNQDLIFAKMIFLMFISSSLIIVITLIYYYYYVGIKFEMSNVELIKYSLFKGLIQIKKSLLLLVVPAILFLFFLIYNILAWEVIIVIGFSLNFYINYKVLK